jgi:AraC-like DNA-binding protein
MESKKDRLVLQNHQCCEIPKKKHIESFEIYHDEPLQRNVITYHEHEYVELYFLTKGKVAFYADGKEFLLEPNDLFIIDSGILHQQIIEDYKDLNRTIIWINKNDVSMVESHDRDFFAFFRKLEKAGYIYIKKDNVFTRNIYDIFEEFDLDYNKKSLDNPKLKFGQIQELISFIAKIFDGSTNNIQGAKTNNKKINDIMKYINDNLYEDISIDLLSAKFFISKFYLMRTFTNEVGCSIHQYIIQQRINQVKKMLSAGITIEEACFKTGFNDYSTFSKAFKKLVGACPRDYKCKT